MTGPAILPPTDDPLAAILARRQSQGDPLAAILARRQSTTDPLAQIIARRAGNHSTGNIDLRTPPGIPGVAADDTAVAHAGGAPADTGLLSRIGHGIASTAEDLYHHPSHLITQPLAAAGRTFLVPVKGEHVSDAARGFAANAGTSDQLPSGDTYTTGQTPQELHRAAIETVANVGAGAVGGAVGARLAPAVGKVAGRVIGRTAANAAAGAVLNPTDPLVGAATNVATGEAFHHATHAAVAGAPEVEPAQDLVYQHSGPSLTPEQTRALTTGATQAAVNPNAHLSPELDQAIHGVRAAPTVAREVANQAQQVVEGLSPEQTRTFTNRLLLDRMNQHAAARLSTAEKLSTLADQRETDLQQQLDAIRDQGATQAAKLGVDQHAAEITGAKGSAAQAAKDVRLLTADEAAQRARGDVQHDKATGKYTALQAIDPARAPKTYARTQQAAEQAFHQFDALHGNADLSAELGQLSEGERQAALQRMQEATSAHQRATSDAALLTGNAAKTATSLAANEHPQIQALRGLADQYATEGWNHLEHAKTLQGQLPEGVDQDPAFQRFVQQHEARVAPYLDRFYLQGGGTPESMTRGELPYFPAVSGRILNDQQVARAMRVAADHADKPDVLTPRTGLSRKLLGQKQSVLAASPLGTEQPAQGELSEGYGTTPKQSAGTVSGLRRTQAVGATNRATGSAASYSPDYLNVIAGSASEGARKAANNTLYQAIQHEGRELQPDEIAKPTDHVLGFTDSKEIVAPKLWTTKEVRDPTSFQPGGTEEDISQPDRQVATHRVVVPKATYDAVRSLYAEQAASGAPSHPLVEGLKKASGVATHVALANPVIAPLHAGRILANVESASHGNLAADAAMTIPGAKVVTGAVRAAKLDTSSPEYIAAERAANLAGALRVDNVRGAGLADIGHTKLFDPNGGWDRKARVLATMDYLADRERKGLSTAIDNPSAMRGLREYVTTKAGNYIGASRGAFVPPSAIAPFAPMHTAGIVTGAKGMVGQSGLEQPTVAQRVGTVLRSPVGAALIGAPLASYALAGHDSKDANVHTGLYNIPGKALPEYHRGDPEEIAKSLPAGTTEYTLRDPGQSSVTRIVSALRSAPGKDKAGEAVREAANIGMSYGGPLAQEGFTLASGHSPYLTKEGDFASVAPPELSKNKKLGTIALAVLRASNAGATGLLPGNGSDRRAASAIPLLSQSAPLSDLKGSIHDAQLFTQAKIGEISREQDAAKRQQIANDAWKELNASGFQGGALRAALLRAVNQAAVPGRSAAMLRKAEAKYIGTTP